MLKPLSHRLAGIYSVKTKKRMQTTKKSEWKVFAKCEISTNAENFPHFRNNNNSKKKPSIWRKLLMKKEIECNDSSSGARTWKPIYRFPFITRMYAKEPLYIGRRVYDCCFHRVFEKHLTTFSSTSFAAHVADPMYTYILNANPFSCFCLVVLCARLYCLLLWFFCDCKNVYHCNMCTQ